MRPLDLQTLKLFVAVCEHRNIARAAEQEVIPLWPEGVPNLRADASPEKVAPGPRLRGPAPETRAPARVRRVSRSNMAVTLARRVPWDEPC